MKQHTTMEAMFELLRKNGIVARGIKPENSTQKARAFALFMAGLWFFYSIGAWYGSRFTFQDPEVARQEPLLFGACLVVWFVAFFGYVSFDLIRKKIKYGS